MNESPYDAIAEWYDRYLDENALYHNDLLPTLLVLAGDIQGQSICDFACGQGWIARELARHGAQVTGVDLSAQLLSLARRYEEQEPLGVEYIQGDVQQAISLAQGSFDGCVCAMSLVDIPDLQAAFRTMHLILKPGGWLVFAITHPCFELSGATWTTKSDGRLARTITGYFEEGFWRSQGTGVRSYIGSHHRKISTYLNTLITSGFVFESMIEPEASDERLEQVPGNREVPSLLLVRARAI